MNGSHSKERPKSETDGAGPGSETPKEPLETESAAPVGFQAKKETSSMDSDTARIAGLIQKQSQPESARDYLITAVLYLDRAYLLTLKAAINAERARQTSKRERVPFDPDELAGAAAYLERLTSSIGHRLLSPSDLEYLRAENRPQIFGHLKGAKTN
jgi:hypothetical protein